MSKWLNEEGGLTEAAKEVIKQNKKIPGSKRQDLLEIVKEQQAVIEDLLSMI